MKKTRQIFSQRIREEQSRKIVDPLIHDEEKVRVLEQLALRVKAETATYSKSVMDDSSATSPAIEEPRQ